MNTKQQIINKLSDKTKNDIIKELKEEFIEEDKKEPFENRDYFDETIRIFDLLLGVFDDNENETNNAIYDVVSDIFRYYGD